MAPKRARDEDATPSTDSKKQKKPRPGFRVGPDNLPDGAWKRKVTKIKKNLITKAKVKKQYAKVKAQVQAELEKRPAVNDPLLIAAQEEEEEKERRRRQAQEAEQQQQQQSGDAPTTSDPSPPPKSPASPTIHPSRLNNLDPRSPPGPVDGPNPNLLDPTHPDLQPRKPRHNNNNNNSNNNNRKHRPDYYSKELSAAQKAREAAEKRAAEIARREAEKQARIADRERFRKQMAKAKTTGKDGKRKIGREGKLLLERVQRLVGDGK